MNNPEYVEIKNHKYKINTDFRVALKCNEIATDDNIGDFERSLAIIYLLFGEEGLNNREDREDLLDLAIKYLSCGKPLEKSNEDPDMDYKQDMDYIEASFMSDYHIDLATTQMHWWKFNKLINGLSNSELGNCCILNRVRNIRNFDTSKIDDPKERKRIEEAKRSVALKKAEPKLTDEQIKSMEELNRILGI